MARSGEVRSFAALDETSGRLARALRQRGVEEGDHVAILMENGPQFLEAAWAAQRSGLYYTAINSHLRAAEVQYVLADSGAKALITSVAMTDLVRQLDVSLVGVRISARGSIDGFENYDDVVASASMMRPEDEREGREMLYSSGTTGRPKGVRKALPGTPFGDPLAEPVRVAQGIVALGAVPGAVYLSPAPLYHSAPLVYSMSMQRVGATVVVMEHFEAGECLALIERHQVTHAQFVPTMFVRMLRLPREERERYDLSSLGFAIHAGAPCPVEVKRQMLDWWGPIIHEYYSGTEAVGSSFITPHDWLAHPGSVGRPAMECHIVDDDGRELPPGESG